jgi:hypothetical protein
MQPEFWSESNDPVGTVRVVVDEFGRTQCRKIIAERTRYVSREEREDTDDFGGEVGYVRYVRVVSVSESEASLEPANETTLAQAATTRQRFALELSLAPVAYETNFDWWLAPETDSPTFGDHWGKYRGLGQYAWYRRSGDRVYVLRYGPCWEEAVKDARKNDYLRQNEANISAEEFAERRELCRQYAELPYSNRETLLRVIASM